MDRLPSGMKTLEEAFTVAGVQTERISRRETPERDLIAYVLPPDLIHHLPRNHPYLEYPADAIGCSRSRGAMEEA